MCSGESYGSVTMEVNFVDFIILVEIPIDRNFNIQEIN